MRISTLSRLILLCSLCITVTAVRAQYVAIPDSNFGNWMHNNGYSSCLTGSSTAGYQLDTTCAAVSTTTSINCNYANIHSLSGIEYFRNLRYLSCSNNPNLTALPVFGAAFDTLICESDSITILPALPATVTYLDITLNFVHSISSLPPGLLFLWVDGNPISALPALPSTLWNLSFDDCHFTTMPGPLPAGLIYLDCTNNTLTTLGSSLPDSLQYLYCSSNHLTSIPSLPAPVRYFYCNYNHLVSLPALNANLFYLEATSNYLTSVPALPASLSLLYCDNNRLTALPTLPVGLRSLDCHVNSITVLPVLPPNLGYLDCRYNDLTVLPALPNVLPNLQCGHNRLTSLPPLPVALTVLDCSYDTFITCLPRIYQPALSYFHIAGTGITCLPNSFTSSNYDINPATLPLCTPSTGCDFYYNLAGTVHYDTATTCVNDSLYPGSPIHGMKVQLKQNGNVIQQFYTFNSGGYSFKTPTLSTYTVDIDTTALPLALVCPASGARTVTLSATDTLEKFEGFGMQCSSVDFGVAYIEGSHFRPTFTSQINISAGNFAQMNYNARCGVGVSGTVTTTLSGSISYMSPAPGALTPASVAGGVLTYNLSNLDTLQAGSLGIIVSTDTGAVAGSDVCVTTVITPSVADANPYNDTLAQCFIVVHSWDPNEKNVYPLDTIKAGDWLTYTVGYQNTGTDTAYLVVVKDTLSANVDASSFRYLGSSAKVVIQLFGSAMVFTFPHINLVDSAANPSKSTGWIQYKVRTKANLNNGTKVRNTASIYFDQNPAVVTDTTVNIILSAVACSDTTIALSHTICQGDSFAFGGGYLNAQGSYSDTLARAGGCDSIITLNLTVTPLSYTAIYDTICTGDSISFGNQYLTAPGTYHDTINSVSGCDIIETLYLTVKPVSSHTITQNICQGNSFNFGGHVLIASGTYHDTLTNLGGCDSIQTLHLTVNPIIRDTLYGGGFCEGTDSAFLAGHAYYYTGVYTDTLTSAGGCDSILTLIVFAIPASYDTIHQQICQGDNLSFGGHMITTAGIYQDTLTSHYGCDSIITLYLTVRPLSADTIAQSICAGNTYIFGAYTLSTQGTYTDTMTSVLGCDSVVTLQLTVNPLSADTNVFIICHGDSFVFGGIARYTSGFYSQVLTGAGGCDSTSVIYLDVKPLPVVTLTWDSLVQEGILTIYFSDTVWVRLLHPPMIFAAKGGYPAGGTYSGNYIRNDTFDFSSITSSIGSIEDTVYYSYRDSNGCSAITSHVLLLADFVGIQEIGAAPSIHLYPNPNRGTFTLETSNIHGAICTISDMLGKVITQNTISSANETIDMHEATEGIYTLTVQGANPIRFVIMR